MSLKSCVVDKKAKTITIVMDLEDPKPSSSGKTLVVASTHGNTPTAAVVDGKPLVVGLNAYIKAAG
ncbi:MAG: hypothetical protein WC455_11250 [Dehalococcoidia bacterium]|jgi:hypothetical protein